jgi:hypothetical protein
VAAVHARSVASLGRQLCLILGGAAVYRCDYWHILSIGFSRCGYTATQKVLFPQLPGFD